LLIPYPIYYSSSFHKYFIISKFEKYFEAIRKMRKIAGNFEEI
jgi:hypothetical protein